ncbi:4Fe-4S dicluster domain-containing protein [Calderihabitans maritimus]|uniref:Nitrite and sulfite reductase 4Fe-4S region n=1 Tax=Calderihabitans maritimus TaxID=1246530 RepID=A0A1Z5HW34_9FIRM|nr:4Fe-4S dicluster domain-containing protein [Calderihabitans maritimus]GAW93746.1 nitrite and sulfite reductase 4Fe-4S region [Calderihabitans maritimus]
MKIDYTELKKGGFIKQRQKNTFVMRLRTIGGNLSSEQLRQIAALADKYGKGYVHLTTRQGVEIPWIELQDYDALKREIRDRGLHPGACGPRVRTIVACPGNEICGYGLIDVRSLAAELDERFFGRDVPVKIKMAVCGCPNSCAKPQENDLGFAGMVEPVLVEEKCISCGVCSEVCPAGAIDISGGIPKMNKDKCLYEGNCIASCPSEAWQARRVGCTVYAGGKMGRYPQLGQPVVPFVPEGQVADVAEAFLQTFLELAQPNERIADAINRVGIEKFREKVYLNWDEIKKGSGGELVHEKL